MSVHGVPAEDPRRVWLRSLGWNESDRGWWTGSVVSTRGGRYRPMSLEDAFEVAVKRCVIDHGLHVELADGQARLATVWKPVTPPDGPARPV